jgi:hypothetical protein
MTADGQEWASLVGEVGALLLVLGTRAMGGDVTTPWCFHSDPSGMRTWEGPTHMLHIHASASAFVFAAACSCLFTAGGGGYPLCPQLDPEWVELQDLHVHAFVVTTESKSRVGIVRCELGWCSGGFVVSGVVLEWVLLGLSLGLCRVGVVSWWVSCGRYRMPLAVLLGCTLSCRCESYPTPHHGVLGVARIKTLGQYVE